MPLNYDHFGGAHAETAVLANSLHALGVRIDGLELSEALILGIGGGLGAGMQMITGQDGIMRIVQIGWRALWYDNVTWYKCVLTRLGVTFTLLEGGKLIAAQGLSGALKSGRPVIAWVDRAHLPYRYEAEALDGALRHVIGVVSTSQALVVVDDLGRSPFQINAEHFIAAHERILAHRQRLLIIDGANECAVDLAALIRLGIRDCVDGLQAESESYALPVFIKWARWLRSQSHPRGWPRLFAERAGLFSALTSTYENTERFSTGGGGLRRLYAGFLDEAADLLSDRHLKAASAAYRRAAELWTAFALSALPAAIEPLRRARLHLDRKYDLLTASL
ncbi:MAG: BtrH N-terminal domain-containing protein, partial [Anaerolinea sp.]|nr:BtrH N-terminal domain-containing protein [Anaerolinea sp.]